MFIKPIKLLVPAVQPEVEISHKGETITFIVSSFGRDTFTKGFEIFEHLNRYISTLSIEEQDSIFASYVEIRNIFDSVFDKEELMIALSVACMKLTDKLEIGKIYDWVVFKSDIIVPNTFKSEYQHSIDRQGSREQTYTKTDYHKLIAMIISIRSIIPVWGEFIYQTRKEFGNLFKEMYAFQLLHKSHIMHSQPMEKLDTYITAIIGKEGNNPTIIMNGISSEAFPFWMLSLVAIRRLSTGDIRGLEPKANIITYIYKYVAQKINPNEANKSTSITEKTAAETDGGGFDKVSMFERYKLTNNLSTGEIIELEYSIKDLRSTAYKISPSLNDELLYRSLNTVQVLANKEVHDPQMTLLSWVFKSVISPRGLYYLNKTTIVNCIGILEAVLVNNGFPYLALLASGYVEEDAGTVYLTSNESRARIPKELLAELDELYPFHQAGSNKKVLTKSINPVVIAIDNLTDKLSVYSWLITSDKSIVDLTTINKNTRRLGIPYDIKIQLAKLVIAIGSRSLI